MKTTTYLELFFEEKEIAYETFEIDHNGQTHFIDTEFTIELIMGASNGEKEQIANTLRKIDFANGDVKHFLKFLAEAYVKTHY